jgi:lysyl-tRNA synthetase, class II
MSSEPEEKEGSDHLSERRGKLGRLRDAGVEPFPHSFGDRTEIAVVRERYAELADGAETDDRVRIAGRLTARRGMGKASFLDLRDGTGQIQVQARLDDLGESYEGLLALDIGDIAGIDGVVFSSRRGELSVRAESWTLLAKSLRPPPDKFHGLEDVETRYRKRELDLMANAETRELFLKRARTIAAVRRWFDDRGFIEVETPVLQPLYGGALARPFTTHHNALDRDLFLRIATELYLKRLIVGGIDKVYELGKDFRNEGVSHKHNPEFTMLEWYEAYADYDDIAVELETLVSEVAQEVLGTSRVEREEDVIDLAPPWRRVTLRDAIRDETGIDVLEHRDRDALAAAVGGDVDPKAGWGKLVDDLLSKRVEPKLIQPTFVIDYPVELSPFAKRHRSTDGLVERWEAFVGGMEISNAFTELNDPDDQRRRFEQQAAEIDRGDDEAAPYDESYVQALEQGMPPTGGCGLGIDRLVMILTGAHSLREVVLFPAMRD